MDGSPHVPEAIVGRLVPYLAWPKGVWNEQLVRLVVESGQKALSRSATDCSSPGEDPQRLGRTMIDSACSHQAFITLLADGLFRDCGRR